MSAITNDLTKGKQPVDRAGAEEAIKKFLECIGLNTDEGNLINTPHRVASAYIDELFSGLFTDPPNIAVFPTAVSTDLVPIFLKDISVRSMCAHHLMPITGTAQILAIFSAQWNAVERAHTVELPGLSKYSRVVEYFSRRPQLQERLTQQVAEFLYTNTTAAFVGVRITAKHHCMSHRGVQEHPEGETTTLAYKFKRTAPHADVMSVAESFISSTFNCT